MTTMSAREFNHDVSAAKRAAEQAPVVITDRGVPSHVLVSIDDYRRMSGDDAVDIVDRLSMSEDDYVEFEPVRMHLELKVPEL